MIALPVCECGARECGERVRANDPAVELPVAAWAVAGLAGAGQDGDLNAILPDHLNPEWHEVVEEHDGWLAVRELRMVTLQPLHPKARLRATPGRIRKDRPRGNG